MQFNVPQFIDIEDRIVGPLTAKQLGWLIMGGIILLILWNLLDFAAFIIAAIFVAGIAVALAFFKPQGIPLASFVFSSITFFTRPKIYVWKRKAKKIKLEKAPKQKAPSKVPAKKIKKEQIEKISQILDQ